MIALFTILGIIIIGIAIIVIVRLEISNLIEVWRWVN